jgi:hypothetical protein
MVDRLRVCRVFLGGDAAHIHSPAGGQGMNSGIQDMINLSWKLAFVIKGQADAKPLDTYADDRIPVIRNVLTKTEGLTDTIGSENPVFRSVFSHIAPWAVGTEWMQENVTERMSQLSLNYRGSPLSVSDGHAGEIEVRSNPRSQPHDGRRKRGSHVHVQSREPLSPSQHRPFHSIVRELEGRSSHAPVCAIVAAAMEEPAANL